MRKKTRTKVKKYLKITGIIIGIILFIIGIIGLIKLTKIPQISYQDKLVCKNYFCEMIIDLNTKKVTRDNIQSSLVEEFGISGDKANALFSSQDEMQKFLSDSVFDVSLNNGVFKIKNKFQTKKFFIKARDVKQKVTGQEITKLSDDVYLLSYNTEKLTKTMYEYYQKQNYVEQVIPDEIFIDNPINDISQTMYGQTNVDLKGYHSLGVTLMGLDNYAKIINENGNPSNIVISTIGYGVNTQNEIFNNKISDSSYNFILDNNDISETIDLRK